MGDADDCRQRRAVRVVDHHGTALGVEPLPQPRSIARQRQSPHRTRSHDPASEEQLAAGRAPHPARHHGEPLDQLAATDADPREGGAEEQHRGHVQEKGAAAQVQRGYQGDGAHADHDEL